MTRPQPPAHHRDPTHAPADATRWFNQWHVYRAIVDANWMAHREIFAAVRAWVLMRHPGPFTLLDLGCGDAGFIAPTFADTGLWAYSGVDASAAALTQARHELAGVGFRVRLVEADMLSFLAAPPADAASYDVILASYAVHHLPTAEKQRFFRLAHGMLAPHGSLLFADIFRKDAESRERYLDRYVGMMRNDWTGLPAEHLASTIDHVTQCDFPETATTVSDMGWTAGFRPEPRALFCDATGSHRLLAFTKPSVP